MDWTNKIPGIESSETARFLKEYHNEADGVSFNRNHRPYEAKKITIPKKVKIEEA